MTRRPRMPYCKPSAIQPRCGLGRRLSMACLAIVVLGMIVWAAVAALTKPNPTTSSVAVHSVTRGCYTPEEIARAYGWQGDWRDYMVRLARLNAWPGWPQLRIHDQLLVLDYRLGADRIHRRANGGGSEGYAAAHRVPAAVTMPLTTNSSIHSTRPERIEPTPGGPAPAMGITSAHRPGRPSYLEHRTHHPEADLLPPWGSTHQQGRAGNRAARPNILLDRVAGPPQHSSNGDRTKAPN